MTSTTTTAPSGGTRVRVQKFGTFLSGMVMPNLPAFIAWGFITSLFLDKGWLPVPELGGFPSADGTEHTGLIGPMITYLLPLLIANAGGRMVFGLRGGVIASIATMGVIVGAEIPMFLGAMIVGPLSAYLFKQLERLWVGKIRAGLEMLVNNFTAGIFGMLCALGAFYGVAPVVAQLTKVLGQGVDWLVQTGWLPVSSLLIEPAKVLFLNNAINHGVLSPLGLAEANETGKSILFLLEANPGPGLGLLLAFAVFGVGAARANAPGAAFIQFVGGIHEIYFPYVLMKPALIVAMIAGGATGITTNMIFGSGLVGPAAPGSIVAVLSMTAKDSYVGVILSVIFSATVSFVVASVILRATRARDLAAAAAGEDLLASAVAANAANKGGESRVGDLLGSTESKVDARPIQSIIFACDAGMGSSAMGATILRKKMKQAGHDHVTVTNKAIANLVDGEAEIIVTHQDLTERARQITPGATHVSVDNFMASPKYDEVVALVTSQIATARD